MKKLIASISIAVVASLAFVGLSPTSASAAEVVCDNTRSTPLTIDDSSARVVVPAGASCFIVDSVIKSLTATDSPKNVSFLGSSLMFGVEHNIRIVGATGTVTIGEERCGYDPRVGNNITIRDSNNVLICEMYVDNNISVTGSTGKVTIRDSIACNNITASRNLPYTGPTNGHNNPGAIRLLELKAANHITAENNAGRGVIRRNLEENFKSPSDCRKQVRKKIG